VRSALWTTALAVEPSRADIIVSDRPAETQIPVLFRAIRWASLTLATQHLQAELCQITLAHILDDVHIEVRVAARFLQLTNFKPEVEAAINFPNP
jgi:hypothetical protein